MSGDHDGVVRGGYRGTTRAARWPAQVCGGVSVATKTEIDRVAALHRLSQADVLRAIIDIGLPRVRARLASEASADGAGGRLGE